MTHDEHISRNITRRRTSRCCAPGCSAQNRSPRTAYTLIEILIVLAVFVFVAGITWPGVTRMYREAKLDRITEDVRVELAGTRIRAIDASFPYQFRYEPAGQRYLVITAQTGVSTGSQSESDTSDDPNTTSVKVRYDELPEGFQFRHPVDEHTGSPSASFGDRLPQEWLAELPNALELSSVYWSPPITFYADGTGTDAVLDIINEDEQSRRISVRALTGAASVRKSIAETSR
jgi:type II secretory pathway pseudopilin PulG